MRTIAQAPSLLALRIFSLAAILLNSVGCDSNGVVELGEEVALVNAAVYTVNPDQEWAEALHVVDGRIQFVGSTAEVMDRASGDASVLDLKGATVFPGFQDVHAHPLEARSPFSGTCLLESEEVDPEAFIPQLRECAPDQIGTDWVLGFGHSVFTLLDARRSPREVLDEAIPDRPAAIMEETSHSVWVNSLALAAAGIDRQTPDPPGGVIVRDPATGEATGLLFDSAGDLVFDHAWAPTPQVESLNFEGLLEAVAELNRFGITSVAEGRTYWRRNFQNAWLRAERENRLTVRAVLNLWAYPSQPDETQLPALRALYSSNEDALVRIDQVKVYADGILINTTAAMLEPYLQTLGGIASQTGLNYFTSERLTRYIAELGATGFDFNIHAIGDRGVREALDAVERGQQSGARHRITHLEVVSPADYPRFQSLNVTADVQVTGDFTQPAYWPDNEPLIGDRASPLVPLRDLHEAGARITLSSDWDVSSLNPFVGIENSITRNPQQLPNLAEAVRAYTISAAYALRQENSTGSLEVDKWADLIVLSQNPFEVPSASISETRVVMTMLGGEIVYQSSEFRP